MFCVDETKLDNSFPNSQFILEHFQFALFYRDGSSKGAGKFVDVKQSIIAKRLENLETKFSETFCTELSKRKNGVFYLHISPQNKIRLYFLKRYEAA